jgi:O-antigen/teichoic acid export membrane protein
MTPQGQDALEPAESLPGQDTLAPGGGAARNTALTFAGQVAAAVLTAVLTIFLVRRLGPEGYGVFSLAFGIGVLVVLPADFGISAATARFVAERRESRRLVTAVLAHGLKLKLISAAIAGGALFVLAGPIASAYDTPALAWPLRGIALSVIGQSVLYYYGNAFIALGRTALNLRAVITESIFEFTASTTLVLLGAGATGAAFGRAIGYAFGVAVALVLIVRLLGRRAVEVRGAEPLPGLNMLRYAGALLIVEGAYTMFGQVDALIIGGFLGATSVGLFQGPLRITALLSYPGLALSAGISPRLARREGHEPDVGALTIGLRWLIVLQGAMMAPLIVWAGPIVNLIFGPAYSESAAVLRGLAPYIFLSGFAPLVSTVVDYLGEARRRIPIALGTLALNLAIDIVYIPKIGIVAGAIGTSAAYAIYVPAHLRICAQLLPLKLRPLASTFLRCALAAAAMAAVLYAVGRSDLTAFDWALGLSVGTAAYGSILFATGEIRAREVRAARTAVENYRRGMTT